ncbi:hypothetical protein DBV15_08089 [Temnothorax longispinosus]|uniref:Hydrocephalus-inducing protein n=1 Tax=Temnothorax longispinosus TaxID=300112 RepID=A0A4S2KRM7_9HYME|nr:hypothetical protein DBV15_08089 [Temnothorax longispinosus]
MDKKGKDLAICYPTIHNSVEIFAAITGESRDQIQYSMVPSKYINQMLMSTQERINYLLKPGRSINVRSLYDNCESHCFRVSPSIVVFQRFIPGNLYTMTLTIRNVTKMSRHLKLSRDPDLFFSVEYHGSNYSTMVAPGLVHIYNVRFSPPEKRDYEYRVEFINDTEIFAVPVIAIGPRPILDIPDRIEIPATAVKIPSSKTILVRNIGDAPAIFNFCSDSDFSIFHGRYEKLFQLVHSMEVVRRVNLVHYNICLPDIHELVCQRIYTDEIASLTNENFRYNHMSFLLTPKEGEIWPQSSVDITVIFRAMEVGEISSVAYLEVTGREDRIPLSLHGTGKGPVFHLNVITIDLSNIFLCSVHNYEIVAANNGHICGTLVHKARPTDFGGIINITPRALTLKPDEYKSFNLTFSSNRKGDFIERIDFVIKESLEVLSLHIKGCVVCPTLHFDRSSIDFGTTALGFSRKQEVSLRNLSLVPVTFGVTIIEDGDQAPLTYEEFATSEVKPSFPTNPREFTIIPQKGVVQAHSSLKLKVSYIANVVRTGQTNMRVDMWDSDSDPVILPLSFCGAISFLSIKPAEINIRFSFINFPYARCINIENNSDLDGYFYIVPQTISENMSIVYSLSSYQGFLKARQSKAIDVTIITKMLGRQTTTLSMLTMGEQVPITSCMIICNGQGPVVSVQPICLNFGEIQVLQNKVMNFHIINDSPIPAQFKITSVSNFQIVTPKKKSPWLVEPTFGEVGPNESAEIKVKLFLRDTEDDKFNPCSYKVKKKLETQETEKLQDSDSENLQMQIQPETLDETLEKLRSIFMSTTETSLQCLDDPEILALIDPNLESPSKELLDDILDIIPHEGILVPYSSQYVRFIFHASEPMQVKVAALCEILQGPTEVINVFASADIVRYSVDKQVIDFGQQVADVDPLIIIAKGVTSYPQIYPCISRDISKQYSTELGYQAIQFLNSDYITMKKREIKVQCTVDNDKPQSQIPEWDERILSSYIETLRKDPSFCERTRDPVKELFASHETKSIPEIDSSQPAKKVCIIFHGAPFTEYQETACRSAKTLQVPLLCIDNVIIEGIALGDNRVSVKLRQIVDDAYQEHLLAFERLQKDNLKTKLPAAKKTNVEIAEHDHGTVTKKESPKLKKSPKRTKPDSETTEIDRYSENDAPPQELLILLETELAKIPTEQDLKLLDPISLYEYKIETILLLQRAFPRYATIGQKISEKYQDDTFLGIEIDLLIQVLGESSREEKPQTSKALANKKEIQDHKELESKVSEKQEVPKELENIANAMNDYHSRLSAIENIIKNWDPLKKANTHQHPP